MAKPFPKPSPAALAAPGAIGACLLWGSAFPAVKIGLTHVPPLTFAGWRFMLAGALLVPLCGRPSKYVAAIRTHWRLILQVSMVQTVLLYATFFLGIAMIQGAHAAIVCGTSPLVTALLAHWLMRDESLTPAKAGVIALGLAGVVLLAVARNPLEPAGLRELAGMALLLGSVTFSSLGNILIARRAGAIRPMVLNSVQIGLGGAVLTMIALVVEGPPRALPPAEFFLPLGWLALVSATCFSVWFALLRHVKVSQLAMWKFLLPLFGAILSWVVLKAESPTWPGLVGVVCVATAVLVNYMLSRNEQGASRTGRRASLWP